jgi:AbrB family looped-hinge helix DNA binding protein
MDRVGAMTTSGRATIPTEIRNELGLKPGDKIEFWIEGRDIRFRKFNPALEEDLGSRRDQVNAKEEKIDCRL